jgi:putative FmdB family regulatory protein
VPIYDYLCSSCRQMTEVIHGIEAPGPRFCPACGAEGTLRKTIATPAFHFKGTGWAKKDRSSAGGAKARAGEGTSTGDAGDGAGKPGEGAGASASTGGGKGAAESSSGGDTGASSKGTSGPAKSAEG